MVPGYKKGEKMPGILTLETQRYAIKLDNFEGPLDLLCSLIEKNKRCWRFKGSRKLKIRWNNRSIYRTSKQGSRTKFRSCKWIFKFGINSPLYKI